MGLSIPAQEAEFHALSYVDANLRLFWWRSQLYRGIKRHDAEFYRNLVQSPLVRELMKDGLLVATEVTDLTHPDFALILKHAVLPVVTYPYEWSSEALKSAALLMLELQKRLTKEKLYLRDPHPWNIVFEGTKPVFVDIGAIMPIPSSYWPLREAVHRHYLNPLRLMAAGRGRIARALLREPDQEGVFDEEAYAVLEGLTGERLRRRFFSIARAVLPLEFRRKWRKNLAPLPVLSPEARLQSARRQISSVELPKAKAGWPEYYGDALPSFSSEEYWSAKERSVNDVLRKTNPKTVLDIGSNAGWYSEFAARQGARVIAIDTDEHCIDRLYRRARQEKLDIQPLVMNALGPSGGDGLQQRLFPPATSRLRSEFVMALALEHHFVFRNMLKFDQITEALADFTQKWLLVEFIPRGDGVVERYLTRSENPERLWERHFGWYNLENFKAALAARFSRITEFPSSPEQRVLLLCEK